MEIIEKAPAKINLGLDALYKREDGYHELNMIMTSVDLADKLQFYPREDSEIVITTDNSFLPRDKRNHIFQAATILMGRFNITQGVRIDLRKQIPVAAGLAGGSSDAAATLRGLNRLWNLGLSMDEMVEIGAEIGSDVPYCVRGNTALVSGRGEILTSLPPMPPCWVVLVKPRLSVSTRTIFSALTFDEIEHPNIKGIEEGIRNQDYQMMIKHLGNSLEPITVEKYPIVLQMKERMLKFGADAALMSGSGPTVFALCSQQSRAQRVYNGLKGFCEEVYLVRSLKQ